MKKKNTGKLGFSLVEIILVMGLIGLLVSAVVFLLNPAQQLKKSRDSTRKAEMKRVAQALENYRSDNGSYPRFNSGGYGWAPIANLSINTGAARYLDPIPTGPASSSAPCNGYVYAGNASSYTIFTKLENLNDKDALASKDPPAFSPAGGGQGGGYQTYSWVIGSCSLNVYNYWINNP